MPETVHPGQYEINGTNQHDHGNYYGDGKTDAQAPSYADETRPAYMSNDAKESSAVAHENFVPQRPRRYCGMRKAILIAVIIVVLVVIIGAVLGGVLGALLHKNHKS